MIKTIPIPLYNTHVILFYKESEEEVFKMPNDIVKRYDMSEKKLDDLYELLGDSRYDFSSQTVGLVQIIVLDGLFFKR